MVAKNRHKDIEAAVNACGYQMHSRYVDSNTKMHLTCSEGHDFWISWNRFKSRKTRCGICRRSERKTPFSVIQKAFQDELWQLLSTEVDYINNETLMSCICPNGHEIRKTWASFNAGKRCDECGKAERGRTRKRNTAKKLNREAKRRKYAVLGDYINAHTPIRFLCPEGHEFLTSPTSFFGKTGCNVCSGHNPDEETRAINVIKDRIHWGVKSSLAKQSVVKDFSCTTLADKFAVGILKHIGPCPSQNHALDHIVPQSFFDYRKQSEIKACWHPHNCRWLPTRENISRGNRLTMEEMEQFTDTQLRILAKASRRPSKFDDYLAKRGIKFKPIKKDVMQLNLFTIGA